VEIRQLSRGASDWFDERLRKRVHGVIYQYEIRDPHSGRWTLEVCMSDDPPKAAVRAIASEPTGGIYEQLRRKTDIFQPCRQDPEVYYHPLGISYLDEAGRLRYRRPIDLEEIPEEIKRSYDIDLYENVSPYPGSASHCGKLVVLISKAEPDRMAQLFILEKVWPVLKTD